MNRVLLGLCVFAGLSAPLSMAKADTSCIAPEAALSRIGFQSAQAGGAALHLTGDRAERFLYYLNEKVGRHTEMWGDAVIVGRFPALGYDTVSIVDDGCVDAMKQIQLDPETTAMALQTSADPNF